jgi:uncharacterized protein YbjT (DUF2867 family)
MRVAVIGGTGKLGRVVVDRLRASGHDAVALSRSCPTPVDLCTGEGLDAALEGADVVVDAADAAPNARAAATLVEGSRRLLEAGARAGVRHHVAVSIVGCEKVPTSYYAVKAQQEALVGAHAGGWSIVRATQFHDLLAMGFATLRRLGAVPAIRGTLAPVDTGAVADLVAEVALGDPLCGRVEIAGPEERAVAEFAREYKRARGVRGPVVTVPLLPKVSRAIRSGALARAEGDRRGEVTFAASLAR